MLQLEVAGTIIQLEDDEAALVVYCNEKGKGKKIKAIHKELSPFQHYRTLFLEAYVIERQDGNKIVYAAIFPRIHFISKSGWEWGCREGSIEVTWERNINDVVYLNFPTLFAGNVTELDWTDKEWK